MSFGDNRCQNEGERGVTYLIPTGTRLKVLVGQVEFLNAQGATEERHCQPNHIHIAAQQGRTYQNSSSSSMTESICWRFDMVAECVYVLCGKVQSRKTVVGLKDQYSSTNPGRKEEEYNRKTY